jgi:hypothetical protein
VLVCCQDVGGFFCDLQLYRFLTQQALYVANTSSIVTAALVGFEYFGRII